MHMISKKCMVLMRKMLSSCLLELKWLIDLKHEVCFGKYVPLQKRPSLPAKDNFFSSL